MSSTAGVSSLWGQRFVRPILSALAVIVFALLSHQLAQEADMITLGTAAPEPSVGLPAIPDEGFLVAAPPLVTDVGDGVLLYLTSHVENHEPWSELGSLCLLLAVVILLASVTMPRVSLLHWWLPRHVLRGEAARRYLAFSTAPSRVALSISRT